MKCGAFTQWNSIQLLRKNEIMKFAHKWMELAPIILGEVNQIPKDKYFMFSLICGYYLLGFRYVCFNQPKKYFRVSNTLAEFIISKQQMNLKTRSGLCPSLLTSALQCLPQTFFNAPLTSLFLKV